MEKKRQEREARKNAGRGRGRAKGGEEQGGGEEEEGEEELVGDHAENKNQAIPQRVQKRMMTPGSNATTVIYGIMLCVLM